MVYHTGIFGSLADDRRADLIRRNTQWLRQAHNLLQSIDDDTYAANCPQVSMTGVSRHMLNLVASYENFLAGLASGRVDYTPTPDPAGTTRQAAMDRINAIIFRLRNAAAPLQQTLWVQPRSSGKRPFLQPLAASSFERELDYLSTQTAHELAMSAAVVQLLGMPRETESRAQAA